MSDYIPSTDAGKASWSFNFAALITAAPATYGLLAGDAVTIQAAADDYNAAYALAIDPPTRTAPTVAAKDVARATMEAVCRPYAMQINANPAVTDQSRTDLGLTVRDTTKTPVPPPTNVPIVSHDWTNGASVRLGYVPSGPAEGKKKPFGVAYLELSVEVSDTGLGGTYAFHERLSMTKSPFFYDTTGIPAGYGVRIKGRWCTIAGPGGKSQCGPWSAPIELLSQTPA